ncbi:MAG TPA: Hsp70 family protein [Polyangiaceae bacterium]|nr:Hsp70 family protein [Polyangiaceae bacterium]
MRPGITQESFYLGIDLGTTNSAATVFDGEHLLQVRGAQGEALTPSVVRIDARGNVTVGSRAYRMLNRDPDNTRGEFKRLMGSPHRYRFAAAKLELSSQGFGELPNCKTQCPHLPRCVKSRAPSGMDVQRHGCEIASTRRGVGLRCVYSIL